MNGSHELPLAGRCVAVTRERPGALGVLLAERGATVLHVPLIEVVDPDDGGRTFGLAMADVADIDWVAVTSVPGAERTAAALGARASDIKVACVGIATAARWEELTGHTVDLVPERQLASSLASAFVEAHSGSSAQRVIVAQADRAGADLVDRLRGAGHDVQAITAYRTVGRLPTIDEIDQLRTADAVLFASGSAVAGWFDALGDDAHLCLPPTIVAIGPSTAAAAEDYGLTVHTIASDHSMPGLVTALEGVWRQTPK